MSDKRRHGDWLLHDKKLLEEAKRIAASYKPVFRPGDILAHNTEQVYNQGGFRFSAQSPVNTPTHLAAENTNLTLAQDGLGNYDMHVRIEVGGTISNADLGTTEGFALQYNRNGGGWVDVNGTNVHVIPIADSNNADGASVTTNEISTNALNLNGLFDEVDGITGTIGTFGASWTEVVFSVRLVDGELNDGDTLDFRLVEDDRTTPMGNAGTATNGRITWTAATVLTPSTATISLTGNSVGVAIDSSAQPQSASLSVAGIAPTVDVSQNTSLLTQAATIAIAAFSVAVGISQSVEPSTASQTISSFAPTVSVSEATVVTPQVASLSFTSYAPSVTISENLYIVAGAPRVNYLWHSEEAYFVGYHGNIGGLVRTNNTITAPDGQGTADTIAEPSSGTPGRVGFTRGTAYEGDPKNGETWTLSAYVKAAQSDWFVLGLSGVQAVGETWFDLTNGVIGTTEPDHTPGIQDVGNGWYRCWITYSYGSDVAGDYLWYLATGDGTATMPKTGSYSVYIWGTQAVRGSTPGTYVRTTTASIEELPEPLVLTSYAPAVVAVQDTPVAPVTASLVLSGQQPSVGFSETIVPSTATISLSGNTVVLGIRLPQPNPSWYADPDTAALTLSAYSPDVAGAATIITPATAVITITGQQAFVGLNTVVTPDTATLTLTGYAPTVGLAASLTPQSASLVISGYQPTLVFGFVESPSTATLTLTGYAPAVSFSTTVTPSSAALILTGYAPVVGGSRSAQPGTGSLLLTAYAPYAIVTDFELDLLQMSFRVKRTSEIILNAPLQNAASLDVERQSEMILDAHTVIEAYYRVRRQTNMISEL